MTLGRWPASSPSDRGLGSHVPPIVKALLPRPPDDREDALPDPDSDPSPSLDPVEPSGPLCPSGATADGEPVTRLDVADAPRSGAAGRVPLAARVRRGLRRRPVAVGAALLLLVAVAGGTWAVVESRKLTVPDLIGLPLTDVDAAFSGLDLVATPQGVLPDAALRDFTTVTGQSPTAGARIFPGSTITYTFELVEVQVPAISGASLEDAIEVLRAAGLTGEATSAQIPVLDTGDTGVGVHAATDSDAIADAVRTLGLTGDIDVTGAAFALHGDVSDDWTVVGADPAPGTAIEAGSSVNLTLTLPLSEMPNVVGMKYVEASEVLETAGASPTAGDTPYFDGVVPEGFPFDVEELAYSAWGGMESEVLEQKLGTPTEWAVHSQAVPAGQVIVVGQEVDLVVEWPKTTVPNIVGLDLEGVGRALNDAGLASHGIYGTGIARSQSYPPGTALPMGANVAAELSHEITFRVTSTANKATVTWAAPGSFSIEQAGGAQLPWSMTWYKAAEPGRYDRGNFNAQMMAGSGSITCEIIINGQVVESRTSTGAYAMVACG